MAHTIEAAKSARSKCTSCGEPIEKDSLRLSEAYVSDVGRGARDVREARPYRPSSGDRAYTPAGPDVWERFYHLPCAAHAQPFKLRLALAATKLDIPEREALERTVELALAVVDAAEDNEATRAEYHQFLEILFDAPDDDHVLVFGDWLQHIGDPRGELVAIQHGLETATGDGKLELADREKKLLAVHSKHLRPDKIAGTYTWRRGFVHRVRLESLDPNLARIFAHPSLRLVRELVVDIDNSWQTNVIAPNLPRPLPATLRTIELRAAGSTTTLGAIAPLLAGGVPQLRRLALHGPADLANLAHPGLAELEITSADAVARVAMTRADDARSLVSRVAELDGKRLPSLVRLVLRIDRGLASVLAALVDTRLFDSVRELALHGPLTKAGLAPLRKRGITLDQLDVRRTQLATTDLDALRPLARTLVFDEPPPEPTAPVAPAPPRDWRVRHTRRPEWGIGRVIEETDAGLQVAFETGGEKLVRNVELLEDVSE